jgi:hypothetical protein
MQARFKAERDAIASERAAVEKTAARKQAAPAAPVVDEAAVARAAAEESRIKARRLDAAQFRACTCAAVLRTRRTCRTGLPARQTTPAIAFAVCGDVAFTGNKSACKTG